MRRRNDNRTGFTKRLAGVLLALVLCLTLLPFNISKAASVDSQNVTSSENSILTTLTPSTIFMEKQGEGVVN
ncbi:hypothetical protein [Paenibacillus caui]|uniref:hypothetical protein n=1 Tax=Paenibacillus caui TaxID=2873927 RepID=UPI001CA94890|nr:hypothetical protein [Paenibacillus caui]